MTRSNIFWIYLKHGVKFLKPLMWIRLPAAEGYWNVFEHFIRAFFCQELLGISIHQSAQWFAAAFRNIRRPGKARRDILCRAVICSQSAQKEGDGFAWRPSYLGFNPVKGRSQITCDLILGHGSSWIPELHQERLRRLHKHCLGDTQMCLKKLCAEGFAHLMIIMFLLHFSCF